MEYNGKCTGRYTKFSTYDANRFNAELDAGRTLEEVLAGEKMYMPLERLGSANRYHMIYTYEVNGKTYIRADKKAHHRKDRGFAISMAMKNTYDVYYRQEDPSQSVIVDAQVIDEGADKKATTSLIMAIIAAVTYLTVIPPLVLCILSIVFGVQAIKRKTTKNQQAYVGVIMSIVLLFMMPAALLPIVSMIAMAVSSLF